MSGAIRYSEETWAKVKELALAGMPYAQIEKMPDMPTRQMMSMAAREQGWAPDTYQRGEDEIAPLPLELLGRRSIEAERKILDVLRAGGSYGVAAALCGITTQTVRNWRKDNPEFDAQCRASIGASLVAPSLCIARESENDFKAAKYRLERNQLTRDEYAPPVTSPLVAIQNNHFNPLAHVTTGVNLEPIDVEAKEIEGS